MTMVPGISMTVKRLILCDSYDQVENSLIVEWLGGQKQLWWQNPPYAERYDEIIIMPLNKKVLLHFDLNPEQAHEVMEFMLRGLPQHLMPGGKIINLNDPEVQAKDVVLERMKDGKVEPDHCRGQGDQKPSLRSGDGTAQSDPEAGTV